MTKSEHLLVFVIGLIPDEKQNSNFLVIAEWFTSPDVDVSAQSFDEVSLSMIDFWSAVSIGGMTECWPWKRYVMRKGYGQLRWEGRTEYAHRVAFRLARGRFPETGKEVCHACDNRMCCNPWHHFEGSRMDNMRDCAAKNRTAKLKGELQPKAILTEAQVIEIRSRDITKAGTRTKIANEFGVNRSVIYAIFSRRSWSHL